MSCCKKQRLWGRSDLQVELRKPWRSKIQVSLKHNAWIAHPSTYKAEDRYTSIRFYLRPSLSASTAGQGKLGDCSVLNWQGVTWAWHPGGHCEAVQTLRQSSKWEQAWKKKKEKGVKCVGSAQQFPSCHLYQCRHFQLKGLLKKAWLKFQEVGNCFLWKKKWD